MANSFAAIAFGVKVQVVRQVATRTAPVALSCPPSSTIARALQSTTDPTNQIVLSCLSYFDSTKIVSTLVAGFSLGALFTFTRDVQETFQFSKIRVYVMRLYHVASLLSFCFSFATILSAQMGSTALLLQSCQSAVGTFTEAFSFLNANLHTEFLLTRWVKVVNVDHTKILQGGKFSSLTKYSH